MFGYALAKMKYRFRGISLTIVIALMSMPVEAIILPLYIEMAQLNWVGMKLCTKMNQDSLCLVVTVGHLS